jgi:pyruvate-ferredoxin/flavodoxin oxidoreductase
VADVHRFWEQTGYFYATGRGSGNLADPYQALSLMPASTGVYRDMTQIRFEYPKFLPESCTACGACFSTCPDSAIPGLVSSISDLFSTAILRVERGMPTQHLRRETRKVEKRLRDLLNVAGEEADVHHLLDQAVLETLAASELPAEEKSSLETEMGLFLNALGDFQLAVTKPYWTNREKKQKGSGGLFSITVNPYTCKGCMECITVCEDGALVAEPQTEQSIADMKAKWEIWLDLPTTDPDFIRIDDLDEKVGALETLLLDKANYQSMVSGDGACMGCG